MADSKQIPVQPQTVDNNAVATVLNGQGVSTPELPAPVANKIAVGINTTETTVSEKSITASINDDSGEKDINAAKDGAAPPLTPAVPGSGVRQKWNAPRSNAIRYVSCCLSQMMFGSNDASWGPLLLFFQEYYNLSKTKVSIIFILPFIGFVIAALISNLLHFRIGQRGIFMCAGILRIISYVTIINRPPFGVIVMCAGFNGVAAGISSAAQNPWVGGLQRPSELLGILHACFGLGGATAPLVVSAMVVRAKISWHLYFLYLLGMAVLEFVLMTASFWRFTGAAYRQRFAHLDVATGFGHKAALFSRPGARVAWLTAMFNVVYVGVELALGGWLVTFMIEARDSNAFDAGMVTTGYWLGLTFGRAALSFFTPYLGVKRAVPVYSFVSLVLLLIFWLVPNFWVSAVMAGLIGFFIGPTFPGMVLTIGLLLPPALHVNVISFTCAFGSGGGALLPFATGAIADKLGVEVLQPLLAGALVLMIVTWGFLPRENGKSIRTRLSKEFLREAVAWKGKPKVEEGLAT